MWVLPAMIIRWNGGQGQNRGTHTRKVSFIMNVSDAFALSSPAMNAGRRMEDEKCK